MQTPYHLLLLSATALQNTDSLDKAGAPKSTYAASGSATIPCNLQPLTSDERLQYDRIAVSTMHSLLMAPVDSAGTAVSLKHGSQVSIGGVKYSLEGNPVDVAGKGVLLKVIIKESKETDQ